MRGRQGGPQEHSCGGHSSAPPSRAAGKSSHLVRPQFPHLYDGAGSPKLKDCCEKAPEELLLQTQSASCNTGTRQTMNNRPPKPSLQLLQPYTLTSGTLHLKRLTRRFSSSKQSLRHLKLKYLFPLFSEGEGNSGGDFWLYGGHQMTHAKETEPVKKKCLGPSLHSTPPATRLKEGSVLED